MIMGDPGRVGTDSRFLKRVGYFVVLLVLIGFQVRPSSFNTGLNFNAIAASTQTRASRRVLPQRVNTPIVLTALAVSTSQINLSWTNNSDKVAGLYVERSTSSTGPWKRVLSMPANATS